MSSENGTNGQAPGTKPQKHRRGTNQRFDPAADERIFKKVTDSGDKPKVWATRAGESYEEVRAAMKRHRRRVADAMSHTVAPPQASIATNAVRLTASVRRTASEAAEKYANITRELLDRRANKVCSALGGRTVIDAKGRAKVVGARVLQAIPEMRRYEGQPDADGRGRWKSSEREVATFDDADLKLIDDAMAKLNKHTKMLAPAVAKRLNRSTQHIEYWATEHCPDLMLKFKRWPIIDPRSNRGFEWVYDADDEKLIGAAMQARKTKAPSPPDSAKPVTVAVAAKFAEKDARYLREMIEDGELSAMKEPYPSGKRGFRYKVLIQDVLNLETEPRASSYKPAPPVKMINGKRCVLTRRACEITGFDVHQLRYRESNPNGTPGGVTLRAHRPEIGGRVRVYWEEQACKDIAAAIERGETSPDFHLKGTAAIEIPPVKIIKGERYVPTRVAVPLAMCGSLEELKQIHDRTGKPRREVVEVAWGRFAYWHEAECEAEGKARTTRERSESGNGQPLPTPTPPALPAVFMTGLVLRGEDEYPLIDGHSASRKLTSAEYDAIVAVLELHRKGVQRPQTKDIDDDDHPTRTRALGRLAKDAVYSEFVSVPNRRKGKGFAIVGAQVLT